MKNLLLLAILLCQVFGIYAQTDTSNYHSKIDHILQPLDPARVTTGILYDRVEPFADLRNFGHMGFADTSSVVHYWQARFELLGADYTKGPADSLVLKNLVLQNGFENLPGLNTPTLNFEL